MSTYSFFCSGLSLIKDLINPRLEITYKELPQDAPKQRKPSIKLAKEKINREPTNSLDIGLKKTIENFKKNLENELK